LQQASQAFARGVEQLATALQRNQEARIRQNAARIRKLADLRTVLQELAGGARTEVEAAAERSAARQQSRALTASRVGDMLNAAAGAAEFEARRLGPSIAECHDSLGRLDALARARMQSFSSRFTEAAETQRRLERALRSLGRDLGRVEEGVGRQVENHRRALAQARRQAAIRANTAGCRALQAGNLAAAEAGFREAIDLDGAPEPRLNLALALILAGRAAEAGEFLARHAHGIADAARPHLIECLAALETDAPDRALEAAEAGLQSSPSQVLLRRLAATAAVRTAQPAAALRHLEAGTAPVPDGCAPAQPRDLLEEIGATGRRSAR
jgi:hypothetical protein